MTGFIDRVAERAAAANARIVLPEGDDPRTVDAAAKIVAAGTARLTVLRTAAPSEAEAFALQGCEVLVVGETGMEEELAGLLHELRAHKGVDLDRAREMVADPLYFGALLVKSGRADGMVCGAVNSTSDVMRCALQVIKCAPGVKLVSSFFVMVVPDDTFGEHGVFVFSDCGLVVNPDAEALSHIAEASAESFRSLVGAPPKVAMLSHSSFGSAAANPDRDKVAQATALIKERRDDLMVDGEMQLDCAIVPSVAASKAPASDVAGHANVLIFPDLDAGNIGYKLVQRLAHAEAYGPITQGLAAPVNDLSRGCSAEDIVGVVAITALQAARN